MVKENKKHKENFLIVGGLSTSLIYVLAIVTFLDNAIPYPKLTQLIVFSSIAIFSWLFITSLIGVIVKLLIQMDDE